MSDKKSNLSRLNIAGKKHIMSELRAELRGATHRIGMVLSYLDMIENGADKEIIERHNKAAKAWDYK